MTKVPTNSRTLSAVSMMGRALAQAIEALEELPAPEPLLEAAA